MKPASTSASAAARPIPLPAPVTSAICSTIPTCTRLPTAPTFRPPIAFRAAGRNHAAAGSRGRSHRAAAGHTVRSAHVSERPQDDRAGVICIRGHRVALTEGFHFCAVLLNRARWSALSVDSKAARCCAKSACILERAAPSMATTDCFSAGGKSVASSAWAAARGLGSADSTSCPTMFATAVRWAGVNAVSMRERVCTRSCWPARAFAASRPAGPKWAPAPAHHQARAGVRPGQARRPAKTSARARERVMISCPNRTTVDGSIAWDKPEGRHIADFSCKNPGREINRSIARRLAATSGRYIMS